MLAPPQAYASLCEKSMTSASRINTEMNANLLDSSLQYSQLCAVRRCPY